MQLYSIDIICLQETRAPRADYYNDDGFQKILSGADKTGLNWAGVGFIIAPWCTSCVESFLQYSDRIAYLKIKVNRGCVGVFSVYAPHNLKPLDERFQFYCDLGSTLDRCSVSGQKYSCGALNARLGKRRPGEEDILGPYCFGREAMHRVEVPNRDLLMEFCMDYECIVANTFQQTGDGLKATYFEPGTAAMDPIAEPTHDIMGLVLAPASMSSSVLDVRSIREAMLMTDHFLVCCRLHVAYDSRKMPKRIRPDREALMMQPALRQKFVSTFKDKCAKNVKVTDSTSDEWDGIKCACKTAQSTLPARSSKPNKPWIRDGTMDLIRLRAAARLAKDEFEVKRLHILVRRSAKEDRSAWVDEALADGSWHAIKKFRKPKAAKQGRLRDQFGMLVSSDQRADTMSIYLESVQWKVRPAGLVDGPHLGEILPIREADFTEDEV